MDPVVWLLSVLLAGQISTCFILIIPIANDFKQRFVEWLDRQEWLAPLKYIAGAVLALVAFLFSGFIQAIYQFQQMRADATNFNAHTSEQLVESERNCFLAGFNLIMAVMTYGTYRNVVARNRLEKNTVALEHQAKSASEACQRFLSQNAAYEKKLKAMGISAAELEKLVEASPAAPAKSTPILGGGDKTKDPVAEMLKDDDDGKLSGSEEAAAAASLRKRGKIVDEPRVKQEHALLDDEQGEVVGGKKKVK